MAPICTMTPQIVCSLSGSYELSIHPQNFCERFHDLNGCCGKLASPSLPENVFTKRIPSGPCSQRIDDPCFCVSARRLVSRPPKLGDGWAVGECPGRLQGAVSFGFPWHAAKVLEEERGRRRLAASAVLVAAVALPFSFVLVVAGAVVGVVVAAAAAAVVAGVAGVAAASLHLMASTFSE